MASESEMYANNAGSIYIDKESNSSMQQFEQALQNNSKES